MCARQLLICAGALLCAVGCAQRENISPMPSISKEARAGLARPVNCATARNDIRILEEERASVASRMAAGVRSVFPISAAAGILSGDYRDRTAVATGTYNRDIEDKIAQIKSTCAIK